MIYLQNPTIPNPTDPIEIDRAIQDLQIKLANSLVWLSHAYPRAYPQIEATQAARTPFIFPSVYLGKSNNDYKYTNVAPDNDKTAQCFFLVDTETINDFVRGEHNVLSYRVSIIFTANLKLVNDTRLATEIFQANLIQQVREVLTREITLTPYDLSIVEVSLLFRDVYREFQLQNAAVLEKAPFTHFRFECDITLQEECNLPISNRCDALKNNIQGEYDLICLLSLYDFSQTAIQNALTPTQVTDLQAAFCVTPEAPDYSFQFNGINRYIRFTNGAPYNFEYNNAHSVFTWGTITSFPSFTPLFTKINNSIIGIFFCLTSTGKIRLLLINSIITPGRAIEVVTVNSVSLSTFQSYGYTYDGSGNASGVKLYLNGVNQAVTILSATLSTTILNSANVELGAASQLGVFGNYSVNSCRVWDIALSVGDATTEGTGTAGKPNDTPVQSLSCIMDTDNDISTFGFDTYTIPDKTNASDGGKTINVPRSARFVQP